MQPLTLGNRDTIRANASRNAEVFAIPLEKIVTRKGFNVRQDMGDLAELGRSIMENGQTVPGRVDVLDNGTFMLVDGHRRYEALKLVDGVVFMAIINTSKTTDEERILQMFTTQDNKQLTDSEKSALIARLANLGWKPKDIAVKLGRSRSYVDNMLAYSRESAEVKAIVESGAISVGKVVSIAKKMPEPTERAVAIKTAVGEKSKPKVKDVIPSSDKHESCAIEIAALSVGRKVTFVEIVPVLRRYFK